MCHCKEHKTDLNIKESKVEILFSFDTTASMYPVLDHVRKHLKDIITTLHRDIPGIRIG